MTPSLVQGVALVPGDAAGGILALREPVSFWGGFDAATGRIVDRFHPNCDTCLSGRVVVMQAGRGSSSGSSVLAEAIRIGTAPAALVLRTRDEILTIGALVALELYGRSCPVVVLESDDDFARVSMAARVGIATDDGRATLTLEPVPEGCPDRLGGVT